MLCIGLLHKLMSIILALTHVIIKRRTLINAHVARQEPTFPENNGL
jgi:hypothetical protein